MTTKSQTSYIPGICNINPKEIAYRRKAAIIGFVVAIAFFVGLLFTSLDPIIRGIIVFFPLFVGVIGVFQVRNRFCVSYGASGKQNATVGSETAVEVNEKDRQTDKQKARSMNINAAIISAVVAIATMFIPHL